MWKRRSFVAVLSLLPTARAAVWGPAQEEPGELRRFEAQEVHMGTLFRIVLHAPDDAVARAAQGAAFARIARLDALLSDYDPGSELSRLSATSDARAGELALVSPELLAVLGSAQELAAETDGAFDVTAGAVFRLWRRARRRGELPAPERIRVALERSGHRHLELDEPRGGVRLHARGLRLDVGGIAKGFAADQVVQLLAARGLGRCLVDAGGDVAVGAAPPGRAGWRIELPGAGEGEPCRLELAHAAIATSGDLERYLEVDGRRYSHLVDPRTGAALTHRLLVTVVAPSGTDADALASGLSVLFGEWSEDSLRGLLAGRSAAARVLAPGEAGTAVWTGGGFEAALSCASDHGHPTGPARASAPQDRR